MLFNLTPAYPLDAGRVLLGVLMAQKKNRNGMRPFFCGTVGRRDQYTRAARCAVYIARARGAEAGAAQAGKS